MVKASSVLADKEISKMKEFLSMEGVYAVTREPFSVFTVWATGRVRIGPAFSQLAVLTSAILLE